MRIHSQVHRILEDHTRMIQVFTVSRMAGVLLASVVLAHHISLDEIGVFEMLLFCGYLFTFFWSEAWVKGYLAQKKAPDMQTTPIYLLLVLLGFSVLSMSVLWFGRQWWIPLLTDQRQLAGLGVFVLYQTMIISVWTMPFVIRNKKYFLALLSVFVFVGPSLATYFGMQRQADVEGVIIGWLVYAGIGFAGLLSQISFPKKIFLVSFLRNSWPVTWPLMLYAISIGIARSFDAWFVAHKFDEATFAVFRYGARDFPLVVALAAGMSTAMIALTHVASGIEELKKRSSRLMHICYPVIGILMLISQPLFVWIFGPAFVLSGEIFSIYLLLTLTQLMFPQTILMAKGDTRMLWFVSLIELLINIAASVILYTWFGLPGIVWGTVIAFFSEKILLFILLKNRHAVGWREVFDFPLWLKYAGFIVFTFILSQWISGLQTG